MFVSMRLYNLQLMGSLETISLEYPIRKKMEKTGAETGLTQDINIAIMVMLEVVEV